MNKPIYPILPLPIADPSKELGAVSGAVGELKMIPIELLRVDGTYQRNFSQGSVRNVRKIAKTFSWAKFLPVIVVKSEDGETYAVVDGQHRTTAAITLGIKVVPCYVLSCTVAEAAGAFAAINGNVTPMSPVDLWFARLASGEAEATALQRCLDAAEVKVTRKKDGHTVGETRSINVLARASDKYGEALLVTILQCITQTGDGNPGLINGAVIHGIGSAIRAKPDLLANPSELFDLMDDIDLGDLLQQARVEQARTGNLLQGIMTREINRKIRRRNVK
jgi:hypothetical protein